MSVEIVPIFHSEIPQIDASSWEKLALEGWG